MINRDQIRIRDGTTDSNVLSGPGTGFDTYINTDIPLLRGQADAGYAYAEQSARRAGCTYRSRRN